MSVLVAETYSYLPQYQGENVFQVAGHLMLELMARNSNKVTTKERVNSSLSHIGALKSERRDEGPYDIEAARQEVMADLLTDGIDYLGNTSLFVMEGRGDQGWHNEASEPYLLSAIAARNSLLGTVDRYTKIFEDADDAILYDVLYAVMKDAKSVVAGKEELTAYQETDLENHLRGLLAEHKVFRAIRESGWRQAYYTSPEEDLHGKVDIVVPLGDSINQLDIQVKGQLKQKRLTASRKADTGIILVTVPMGESHSMRLKESYNNKLTNSIRKFAALTLQTGVNEVQLAA